VVELTDARLEIVDLHEVSQLRELESLLSSIWARTQVPPVNSETLRALSHTGNYVAGARRSGRLVGGLVGFFGSTEDGERFLHSHILGVEPEAQARGVGYALKQHQRRWARERGLETITWTFDPLVSRNAYFNLAKLGAEIAAYHVNFYGGMDDAINGGDESDRVLALWRTRAPRLVDVDVDSLLEATAPVVLRVGASGEPVETPATGAIVLCQIPEDIVRLRQSNPTGALAWRHALRSALGERLTAGYRARGVSRTGWYVLQR
jgi:predicted GNAT superfamily acetyltransferase